MRGGTSWRWHGVSISPVRTSTTSSTRSGWSARAADRGGGPAAVPDHVTRIAPPRLRRAAALLNASPASLGVSRRLLADLVAYERAAARATDAARDHERRSTWT